jgi:hypothetical protein
MFLALYESGKIKDGPIHGLLVRNPLDDMDKLRLEFNVYSENERGFQISRPLFKSYLLFFLGHWAVRLALK